MNKEQSDACRALHQASLGNEVAGFAACFRLRPFDTRSILFAPSEEILRDAFGECEVNTFLR